MHRSTKLIVMSILVGLFVFVATSYAQLQTPNKLLRECEANLSRLERCIMVAKPKSLVEWENVVSRQPYQVRPYQPPYQNQRSTR